MILILGKLLLVATITAPLNGGQAGDFGLDALAGGQSVHMLDLHTALVPFARAVDSPPEPVSTQ